jgi:uncharacterized protein
MSLRDLAADAGGAIERALNEDVIRLAVTGLSRAGKTVFITSLIQNLLALGAGKDVLPRLSRRLCEGGANRLRSVTILSPGNAAVPQFDLAAKLAGLTAETPLWPDRTDDVARIALALTLTRRSALGQRLGERRVRLEILDYPGEWLLDLPLLGQDYLTWSAQTLARLRQPPWRDAAASFLGFVAGLRPGDRANEDLARHGHRLYKAALAACQAQHGLRYLQPGRFLCPGPRGDVPLLWFFPMDAPPAAGPARDSLMALLSDRFAAYQRDVRSTFFDTQFRAFDRQVLLVDVLGALHAGRAAFHDTARALNDITAGLRYGASPGLIAATAGQVLGRISALAPFARPPAAGPRGGRRIGHVVFVATKADHVPAPKRAALRHLLRALADAAEDRPQAGGAAVRYQAAAALRATEDAIAHLDGHPVEVVRGRLMGEDRVRPFYPGEVPLAMPADDFWSERFFQLPRFRPPPIDPSGRNGLPHLGLDHVLDDLLGDLL